MDGERSTGSGGTGRSATARPARPRSSRRAQLPPEIARLLDDYLAELSGPDADLAREIVTTALLMGREQVSRLDRKIVNSSLKEMRRAFRVFAPYKRVRKVSIFGSARTVRGDPEYEAAAEFSRQIAARGWMVITGAGPGIMEAGQEGAGVARSFGVNIRLPFEAKPNPVIANDSKLINFKYFFTRKLTFMKEAHAFVLLPGGFGTMDEAFELLTLVQTGKSDLYPIVLLDAADGSYWRAFDGYIRDELLSRRLIDPDDVLLYRHARTPADAVHEIDSFYRLYHSSRMVGDRLILRLTTMPDGRVIEALSREFADILRGPIEPVGPSRGEIEDRDVPELPRLSLPFDRQHVGRLRVLVDRLNESTPLSGRRSEPHSTSR